MNLFQKYGIKEVADVTFYSINSIGDEEIYTPVLFLDTLKVSTISKTAQKATAQGGYGNKKLITWNFGKEISLNLEDALFTPASMSMIWGGELQSKLSPYSSAIVKLNIANKYGKNNYSIKAYPSPVLTEDEWEIVFRAATECNVDCGSKVSDNRTLYWVKDYYLDGDEKFIEQNRKKLKDLYAYRNWSDELLIETNEDLKDKIRSLFTEQDYNWLKEHKAMPQIVLDQILNYVNKLSKLGNYETQIYETECIDRMENCVVTNKNGFVISTAEQKRNLLRYYQNDKTSSYTIYYDSKTMLPLLNITDEGLIKGWDARDMKTNKLSNIRYDRDFDTLTDVDTFKLRIGTTYKKFTRTIKYKTSENDGILGRTFVIDSDTFPDVYKITGETYIRDQKTGKDQRCQFIIHRAQVSSDTNISLQAEGEPTTFSMSIDVLAPINDVQMELKVFDIDDDIIHGGTRIVPQRTKFMHTKVDDVQKKLIDWENSEII